MSTTRRQPSVAIVGASGHLGKHVASALLSSRFRPHFSEVILLKRAAAGTSVTQSSDGGGATIRFFDEHDLRPALAGVDVLVNTVGPSGHDFKDRLLRAIPGSGVQIYIPSEFGVDHTVHDFPHAEWDKKKHHFSLAQDILSADVRVCRLFIGLFIEDSIGPWFGFDTAHAKYECVGSADVPVSYTSLGDVGNVVASVAQLSKHDLPPQLHVGGDTLSVRQLARVMEQAGSSKISITELDLASFKRETIAEQTRDPSRYLRFLMGEGKINHSNTGLGNDNELVNPRQSLWKWKTLADYAKETDGRPWADYKWSADTIQ